MTKPIASVSTLVLGLVLGLGLGLGATSCTSKREHCWYAEGDATCEAEFGAGYFCVAEDCEGFDQNLGCVSEMPSEECHAPNGMDDGSSESESESSTDATTETMESTDADPTDTDTTTGGCMQDAECMDPSAPICVDEACVGCGEGTDGACKQADPSLPVCDVGSGACVQCLAGGDVSACGPRPPRREAVRRQPADGCSPRCSRRRPP